MRLAARNDLNADFVMERISYDLETGIAAWKSRGGRNDMFNARCAGKKVSSKHPNGYVRIGLAEGRYLLHRIIWLYVTGEWPRFHIDHVNSKKYDNRWANLREATVSQNGQNVKRLSTNTSGLKGVSWHKASSMWRADICVNRRQKSLGIFNCPAAASFAYQIAADKHFKEFARLA